MVQIDQRWLDCEFDPEQLNAQSCEVILNFHQHPTWQPCLPQIAALAFLSEPASGDEWE
jgi:hypothetical protein